MILLLPSLVRLQSQSRALMYTSKPYGSSRLTFIGTMVGSLIFLYRLYEKFSLEIIIATSLGHYIDVLNGEANPLIDAANEIFNFMRVDKVLGIPELSLIICKFEVLVDITVYQLSTT